MKTAHVSSKGPEVKCAWRCYVIWWFDALALLAIMLLMSARKVLLQRSYTHQAKASRGLEEHDADWVTAQPIL